MANINNTLPAFGSLAKTANSGVEKIKPQDISILGSAGALSEKVFNPKTGGYSSIAENASDYFSKKAGAKKSDYFVKKGIVGVVIDLVKKLFNAIFGKNK